MTCRKLFLDFSTTFAESGLPAAAAQSYSILPPSLPIHFIPIRKLHLQPGAKNSVSQVEYFNCRNLYFWQSNGGFAAEKDFHSNSHAKIKSDWSEALRNSDRTKELNYKMYILLETFQIGFHTKSRWILMTHH